MLKDLDTVLRKAGLKTREVRGWSKRGHGRMADVKGIIVHHTAGPVKGNHPSLATVVHGRPDLKGPLCNLLLARDGTFYVVAGGKAWHAGNADSLSYALTHVGIHTQEGNSYLLGIEVESHGNGDFTKDQCAALIRGCGALAKYYDFPARHIIGHKEWAPSRKIDPAGINMDHLRNVVRKRCHTK